VHRAKGEDEVSVHSSLSVQKEGSISEKLDDSVQVLSAKNAQSEVIAEAEPGHDSLEQATSPEEEKKIDSQVNDKAGLEQEQHAEASTDSNFEQVKDVAVETSVVADLDVCNTQAANAAKAGPQVQSEQVHPEEQFQNDDVFQ
jgi:hypothetical protein